MGRVGFPTKSPGTERLKRKGRKGRGGKGGGWRRIYHRTAVQLRLNCRRGMRRRTGTRILEILDRGRFIQRSMNACDSRVENLG